jgi:acyl-CoA thioester hydrolase
MVKSLTHTTVISVRFSECDPLKIVWHGNYLRYFEDGRESFGKTYNISYLEIYENNGLAVPLVHVELDYKRQVGFGEELKIETTMVDDPAAKIVFHYRILNEKNEVVCTGKTIQAFVDMAKKELQIVCPPFFEAWKNKFLK